MESTFLYLYIVSYILAGVFLLTSVLLFFRLDIRRVIKDKGGALEQRQIEEIRAKRAGAGSLRGKVNVFEELEKKAKPKRADTARLQVGTSTGGSVGNTKAPPIAANPGTTILEQSSKALNPNFIIEKNIVFVNTNEVV
ncbi:MAG: hypothetical protein LBL63_00785 [Clostridiales Family XIII bacterium]|nr:hypothetical protein [Clostridiales Family XIII bacterium]